MPVYNVADYIESSINSCLVQSFDKFEIIVVDDCGTDQSIAIALRLADKDTRIKIVHHEKNFGTYHARHTGVLNATGKYILFLDPDDRVAKDSFIVLYKEFCKNSGIDIFLFNMKFIPSLKAWTRKPRVPIGIFSNENKGDIFKVGSLSFGTGGKVYRRGVLLNAFNSLNIPLSYRLIYGEDVLVFASSFLNSQKISGIENELYLYCRNESSITFDKSAESKINKTAQLETVLHHLKSINSSGEDSEGIYAIQNDIELSILFMKLYSCGSNRQGFDIARKILFLSRSWRVLAKLALFFSQKR